MRHGQDQDAAGVIGRLSEIGEDILQGVATTLRGVPDGIWTSLPSLLAFGRPDRIDAVGDFLDTYEGPRDGDLDVVVADAALSAPDEVVLRAVHAAPVGTTEGAAYVWGVDRGAGEEILAELDPPAGEGVAFDAVVILLPDGTGSVIDLAGGGAPEALDPSDIEIAGPLISVRLSSSLLPSQGLDFGEYGYNLWPRYAPDGVDPADNTQISDFAPDASTTTARAHGDADPWSIGLDALGGALDALAEVAGWADRSGISGGGLDLV